MKKFITTAIVMTAALTVFSFSGALAEQVTLRFSDWHLTEDVWNKSLNEGMDIFQKNNPNIKVVMEPVSYGEKETKYTVESAAGRAPDVFHVHAFSLPMFLAGGMVNRDLLFRSASLLPGVFVGVLIGIKFGNRLKENVFRSITLVLILVMGVMTILSGLS